MPITPELIEEAAHDGALERFESLAEICRNAAAWRVGNADLRTLPAEEFRKEVVLINEDLEKALRWLQTRDHRKAIGPRGPE